MNMEINIRPISQLKDHEFLMTTPFARVPLLQFCISFVYGGAAFVNPYEVNKQKGHVSDIIVDAYLSGS